MTDTIFASTAPLLRKRGFQPIPVEPLSKATKILEWARYSTEDIEDETLKHWIRSFPNHNVGIVCGPASGVICLDIDADLSIPEHNEAWNKLEKLVPQSPVQKVGSKLPSGFFRYNGEKSENFKIAGKTFVEILSVGKQTVVPPSVHPSTKKPYSYVGETTLLDFTADDLPFLPKEFLDAVREQCEKEHRAVFSGSTAKGSRPREIPSGSRNNTLTQIAGAIRKLGYGYEVIDVTIQAINEKCCSPSLPSQEVSSIASSISKYESEREWDSPLKIPDIYPAVDNLDSKLLPPQLREIVLGIAEDLQVPTEMVLMPILVSLGSLNGSQIVFRPDHLNPSWFVPTNLSGVIVARSGERKSPIFNSTIGPLYELQKELDEDFLEGEEKANEVIAEINIEIDLLKKQDKKLLGEDPPDKSELKKVRKEIRILQRSADLARPKEKRIITNDSTAEALGELCRDNGYSLLAFRDELTGMLEMMERSGREGERQFILEALNGTSAGYIQDRIGRGKIKIPRMTVSLLGGAQPVRMQDLLSQVLSGSGDDGLLQRLQCPIWPNGIGKYARRRAKHKIEAREELLKLYRLFAKSRETFRFQKELLSDVHYIPLEFAADNHFGTWNTKLQNELRSGKYSNAQAFESFKNKQPNTLIGLAGIHQFLLWTSLSGKPSKVEVGLESIEWATEMVSYFEQHARKLFSCILYKELVSAHALAQKILEGRVKDGSPKRSVYRPNWAGLNNLLSVDLALAVLEEKNWIRLETRHTEGRPSEIVRINPEILKRVSDVGVFERKEAVTASEVSDAH
jgi:hypothetical protein